MYEGLLFTPRPRNASAVMPRVLFLSLLAALVVRPAAAQSDARAQVAEPPSPSLEARQCGELLIPKNERESYCLRGKVKIVTNEARAVTVQEGRPVEWEPHSIVSQEFGERGNRTVLAISDHSPGPVGQVYRRLIFSFDAAGHTTGWKSYQDGDPRPLEVSVYSYDERGNRVREEFMSRVTNLHSVGEFSYDSQGRMVESKHSDLSGGGGKTWRGVSSYDGHTLRYLSFSGGSVLTGKGTRVTDDRGAPLSEEHYSVTPQGEECLRTKISYRYDRKGLLAEKVYHKAEPLFGSRAAFEYDDRGNLISATRYGADGTFAVSEHFEYEYDDAGNWVRRVKSYRRAGMDAPQPYYVERRNITYY